MQQHGTDITLQQMYTLWERKATALDYSPVTIRNTRSHLSMIDRFIPLHTPIASITEEDYYAFIAACRVHGYAEETIHTLNATLRKMIRLAQKRRLIQENVLDGWENARTKKKHDHALVLPAHYAQIDAYFRTHAVRRSGVDHALRWRLLFSLLYHTGIRIGEALALTPGDFLNEDSVAIMPGDFRSADGAGRRPATSISSIAPAYVVVSKSYSSDFRIIKEPKNHKSRTVPLIAHTAGLTARALGEDAHTCGHSASARRSDTRIFPWSSRACSAMLRNVCARCDLPAYTCHSFRHTFISNLIAKNVPLPVIEHASGDTQATILARYSHMFPQGEDLIRGAMSQKEPSP